MPLAPGAAASLQHQLGADAAVGVGVGVGQDLEGGGLQGVAGQDRGGLVIGLVHRRPAAAQVVVVHARQVVVDQAVGVDALQRAGGAQHRPLRQVEHLAGLQREEGPQPLAGPERRIAHGLGQPRFRAVGARQQLVQRDGDQVGGLGDRARPSELGPHRRRHQENSAGSTPGGPAGADDDLLDPQPRGLEPWPRSGPSAPRRARTSSIECSSGAWPDSSSADDLLELGQRLLEAQGGDVLRLGFRIRHDASRPR